QRFHTPVVWGGNAEGRQQIQEYREQGYYCEHKHRQWYKCKKFYPPHTPDDLRNKIAEKAVSSGPIRFGTLQGWELKSQVEAYREWHVQQPISFGGLEFDNYIYIETPNLTKIEAGDFSVGTGISFVVEGNFRWMQIVRR